MSLLGSLLIRLNIMPVGQEETSAEPTSILTELAKKGFESKNSRFAPCTVHSFSYSISTSALQHMLELLCNNETMLYFHLLKYSYPPSK